MAANVESGNVVMSSKQFEQLINSLSQGINLKEGNSIETDDVLESGFCCRYCFTSSFMSSQSKMLHD